MTPCKGHGDSRWQFEGSQIRNKATCEVGNHGPSTAQCPPSDVRETERFFVLRARETPGIYRRLFRPVHPRTPF